MKDCPHRPVRPLVCGICYDEAKKELHQARFESDLMSAELTEQSAKAHAACERMIAYDGERKQLIERAEKAETGRALAIAGWNQAKERAEKAEAKAEDYRRDWYEAKVQFGDAMAQIRQELRDAKASAEKYAAMSSEQHAIWTRLEHENFDLNREHGALYEILEAQAKAIKRLLGKKCLACTDGIKCGPCDAGEQALSQYEARPKRSIPMVLHCPQCQEKHIDKDIWATRPHRTHLCEHCQHLWKPYSLYTVGVESLEGE